MKRTVGKILFALTLLALLYNCLSCTLTKQQRRSNKVAKKIEKMKAKWPDAFQDATTEIVRIDTLLVGFEIEGKTKYDTIRATEYIEKFLHDTVSVVKFRDRILEMTKDTVRVDSLGVHAIISGSGISYTITKDEALITAEKAVETITIVQTEVVRKSFFQDWKFWVLVVVVVVVAIFKDAIRARF